MFKNIFLFEKSLKAHFEFDLLTIFMLMIIDIKIKANQV